MLTYDPYHLEDIELEAQVREAIEAAGYETENAKEGAEYTIN